MTRWFIVTNCEPLYGPFQQYRVANGTFPLFYIYCVEAGAPPLCAASCFDITVLLLKTSFIYVLFLAAGSLAHVRSVSSLREMCNVINVQKHDLQRYIDIP